MRRTLVIFAKVPGAGRVKTRLARGIGTVPAAWWFRHQLARLVRRVGRDPRWETVLAVAPDTGIASRALPSLPRFAQGPGDLGDRMGRAFCALPPGPVVIIGGDIPGITPHHIAEAFRALGRHEAVVGPAPDGGYWLIGMRRGGHAIPAHLFEGVRWSSEHALTDTLATLGGLSVGRVATLADVDTAHDLRPAEIRASL